MKVFRIDLVDLAVNTGYAGTVTLGAIQRTSEIVGSAEIERTSVRKAT